MPGARRGGGRSEREAPSVGALALEIAINCDRMEFASDAAIVN